MGPLADETPDPWDAPAKVSRIAMTIAPVGRPLGGAEPREGLEPSAMTARSGLCVRRARFRHQAKARHNTFLDSSRPRENDNRTSGPRKELTQHNDRGGAAISTCCHGGRARARGPRCTSIFPKWRRFIPSVVPDKPRPRDRRVKAVRLTAVRSRNAQTRWTTDAHACASRGTPRPSD